MPRTSTLALCALAVVSALLLGCREGPANPDWKVWTGDEMRCYEQTKDLDQCLHNR